MDRRGEEPDQPPGAGLRDAGGRLPWLTAGSPRTGAPAASASTCTGRSARRNARIATSTATCGAASTSARWRRALVAEVAAAAAEMPGRTVDTVFFGGGTPSLMPPETVAAVIAAIAAGMAAGAGRGDHARGQPDLGRGRPVPRLPRRRGQPAVDGGAGARRRRPAGARADARRRRGASRAFEVARAIFPRVSFDLIYARQGQTLAAWRRELGRALAMAVDHLSLYQLTIEPGTRFGDLAARGRLRGLPGAEAGGGHVPRDAGGLRGGGDRGLRDLEPRAAGGGEPAQPRLLALRRLCRDRAGRARPADRRRARAGRPRRSGRRRPGWRRSRPGRRADRPERRSRRGAGGRDADDGAAARRGHRPRALRGAGRRGRCRRRGSRSSPTSGWSRAAAAACGHRRRAAGARRGAAAAARPSAQSSWQRPSSSSRVA